MQHCFHNPYVTITLLSCKDKDKIGTPLIQTYHHQELKKLKDAEDAARAWSEAMG